MLHSFNCIGISALVLAEVLTVQDQPSQGSAIAAGGFALLRVDKGARNS